MTEEHRDELAAARAEVVQAHEELERFASVANHDLRSAIFTVRSFLELLEEEEMTDNGRHLLGRALQVTDRMQRLVDALTNHVRATSREVRIRTVGLDQVVEDVLARLRPVMVERDATVEVAPAPLPSVQADPEVLVDVLALVVDNAVRYRAGTTPGARVQLAAHEQAGTVTVTVDDDGPGLPEGTERSVFEPFERTAASKGEPGTGLGLSTARRLVARLDGSIHAARRTEGGTRIALQLPAAGGAAGPGPTR